MRGFSAAKQVDTRAKRHVTRTRRSDRAAICIKERAPALLTINDAKTIWKDARQQLTLAAPLRKERLWPPARWRLQRNRSPANGAGSRESLPSCALAPHHRELSDVTQHALAAR